MPEPPPEGARAPFAYAIVRVVPHVERGERLNAGIVLLCRPRRFLGAEMRLDEARLRSLDPACDVDEVREHLDLGRARDRNRPRLLGDARAVVEVVKPDRIRAGSAIQD